MGLNIRLYGINSPKPFTLSYRIGKTAGDESVIATGYTSYGSLYPASTSRNYTNDPIIFTNASFDTQYWFKLTYTGDTGDVDYYIENIFTNEAEVYDNCINCCYFPNVGYASYVPPPTPTPSATMPPCDFSGGSASIVIGPTPTPNPTNTPAPSSTPNPTSTVAPTATPTQTVSSCLSGDLSVNGNCSSGDNSSFTLSSGYSVEVVPSGFFYSGTGTRYAYAELRDGFGVTIQTFTMTQVNSNTPTFSPSTYTLSTPGTYQLYAQQVDCNQNGTGGSGSIGLVVQNCQIYTPPPTPTATAELGQCYTYTLNNVSNTAYGVSYKPVGGSITNVQFNSLASQDMGNGVYDYPICSTVEPTLLDCSNWPSTIGIGYANGITRTGPNGSCSNNFDCFQY